MQVDYSFVMGIQPYKREALRQQVIVLYKQGMTFREIGKALKISHETARTLWDTSTVDKVLDTTGQGSSIDTDTKSTAPTGQTGGSDSK